MIDKLKRKVSLPKLDNGALMELPQTPTIIWLKSGEQILMRMQTLTVASLLVVQKECRTLINLNRMLLEEADTAQCMCRTCLKQRHIPKRKKNKTGL